MFSSVGSFSSANKQLPDGHESPGLTRYHSLELMPFVLPGDCPVGSCRSRAGDRQIGMIQEHQPLFEVGIPGLAAADGRHPADPEKPELYLCGHGSHAVVRADCIFHARRVLGAHG